MRYDSPDALKMIAMMATLREENEKLREEIATTIMWKANCNKAEAELSKENLRIIELMSEKAALKVQLAEANHHLGMYEADSPTTVLRMERDEARRERDAWMAPNIKREAELTKALGEADYLRYKLSSQTEALKESVALLRELRDAVKASKTMDGREYIPLGLAVNRFLEANPALATPEPAKKYSCQHHPEHRNCGKENCAGFLDAPAKSVEPCGECYGDKTVGCGMENCEHPCPKCATPIPPEKKEAE